MFSHPASHSFRSLLLTASFGLLAAAAAAEDRGLLVKSRLTDAETELEVARAGAKVHGRIDKLGVHVLRVPAASYEKVVAALSKSGKYEYVEEDAKGQGNLVPNDPSYGSQWHLPSVATPAAWDSTMGNGNVVIAVLDTGVDMSHPDLAGKILPGYDYVNGDSDPSDDHGHGTSTSGTAAAWANNAVGVAGVAPNCYILPFKVLDSANYGYYSNWAAAMIAAADQGARIISISASGTSSSTTLQNAVNYAWSKGCVVVASAGNAGTSTPNYPAACVNVVAVSATDTANARCSWSSFGAHLSVCAPGAGILTTAKGGGYASKSGTSFSAPIVAGVAALVASARPELTNKQIVDVLRSTATDLGTAGFDSYFGHGKVNSSAAVAAALALPAADVTAPVAQITLPEAVGPLSGVVTVFNDATDNVGVSTLDLYIGSTKVASAGATSLDYAWNTLAWADGNYTVKLVATDAAGNQGQSTLSVTVKNAPADTTAPTVAITSPSAGTVVLKSVKVGVSAADNVRVTKVELYGDGVLIGSSSSAPVTFTWNTSKLKVGSHSLVAKAYDAAGNVASSATVTVQK